jgi:Glycerol uptake facilitator and related permeases (Major Intrinsic Protein Family)
LAAESKSRYLFEIVGTFIFVFAICSAATVYSGSNKLVGIVGLGQLAMAVLGLVHAFVLTALVYAINARSGAQLNPAVTIAFLVSRKMRGKVAALTIACQVLGAVMGAAVVYSMFGSEMAASVVLPKDGNAIRALILETVMAFILVYVVLATTRSEDFKIAPLAGVAIGFTLGVNFMLGGPISGGAMNPARAFAPALIVWNFDYQWIYWVAPILGGIIAAGLYKGLHSVSDIPSPKEEQMK